MLGSLPTLSLPAPPSDRNLGRLPLSQVTEQSHGTEEDQDEENNSIPAASVPTHTKIIGMIYPPPDIRVIVGKTVQFVGKMGPEFEKTILAKNAGNVNFNFLIYSDPYHAYYQDRLSEFHVQNQGSTSDSSAPEPHTLSTLAADDKEADPSAAQFRPLRKVLEPPEAEQYTVRLPEGNSKEEVDIIKLTAQFVARNGRSFLTGLTIREGSNPQFHFLHPTHSMFTFFTYLADAYSKALMPPKGLVGKLRKSVADRIVVLERCLHRLEWERSQEQARQRAEDEVEQERMQMAIIDWHDFVVVGTIDFADDEDEELHAPMTLEEVARRSKLLAAMEKEDEDIAEPGKEVEMEMDDEEVQLVEEGTRAASLEEDNGEAIKTEMMIPPTEDDPPIRIVKNWKRPEESVSAEKDALKYVKSPLTSELIPVNEMSEHMRISLIDPKYKDQKERMYAKIRETTLAQDEEICRNIVGLARSRPDIFGTTEEEVSDAVKAEIEKKKDEQPKQVIWDGHSGSVGRTANQAMAQNTNGEDMVDPAYGNLPGSAGPTPGPGVPLLHPLPPPPGVLPRLVQYTITPNSGMQAPLPLLQMIPPGQHRIPLINLYPDHQHFMMNQLPTMQPPPRMTVDPPGIPVSTPSSGSQFTPVQASRPFVPIPPQPGMHMMPPPPLPQGMMPPHPPPKEAPSPLLEEPKPKRQKAGDSVLIPEDQFLAQYPGPVLVSVSVPNVDEGNLKGQVLEIIVQSLSETVGSLKEKIAGEIQLPSNKQKLSGKPGFLKDNLSLAYYNIAEGEGLTLSLRERGGRKR